ncbi:MAG: spermidine/putrescine transport system permease protein, partial [Loktanella salsilacus]
MSRIERAEQRTALTFVAPALLWTLAFFLVPFAAMVLLSLAHLEGREVVQAYDLGNYVKIFTDPSLLKGI